MFAQFLLDFSQQKVRFAQVLAFSKVAKTEGEVFVAPWASQGDFEPSRATISPQSPCSLIPAALYQNDNTVQIICETTPCIYVDIPKICCLIDKHNISGQ